MKKENRCIFCGKIMESDKYYHNAKLCSDLCKAKHRKYKNNSKPNFKDKEEDYKLKNLSRKEIMLNSKYSLSGFVNY